MEWSSTRQLALIMFRPKKRQIRRPAGRHPAGESRLDAQIDDVNRPDRQADASASMLRRARRRTVPGHSLNSPAVPPTPAPTSVPVRSDILSARLTDSCGPLEKPVGVGHQRHATP